MTEVTRIALDTKAACPCGSSRTLKQCCWTGRWLRPPPSSLKQPQGSHANEGCYLNPLAGCCEKITLEHFLSRNVQESIASVGPLTITGLRDEPFKTNPSRFGSKILCATHNSALSPLDDVGGRFFRGLGSAYVHLRSTGGNERQKSLINGYDFERWLLKTLVGLLCATNQRLRTPRRWLEVLVGDAELQAGEGLYLDARVGVPELASTGAVRIGTILEDAVGEAPVGFVAHLGGFTFGLAMKPGVFRGVYRPMALLLTNRERASYHLFGWDSEIFNRTVHAEWVPPSD